MFYHMFQLIQECVLVSCQNRLAITENVTIVIIGLKKYRTEKTNVQTMKCTSSSGQALWNLF